MESKLKFPAAKLLFIIIFSIAMAFMEAAIVVYLRQLYYPGGFSFPLKIIPLKIYLVEIGREAATLIMLAAVGWFSAKSFLSRFAGFVMAFGIWDIFYYVFLKIMLNWPAGMMDWDILFLIPLPWVGPVLAPVIVSIALIGTGLVIWARQSQGRPIVPASWHWLLEILAGLIIIWSFLTNAKSVMQQGVPVHFHWELFCVGMVLGVSVFVRSMKNKQRIYA
ncbi:MAG: hypothetical protein GXO75_16020 [Calditrichaeota bacterium]|nr:hypothetical protein [Calditrichota bacterium]